MRSLQLCSDSIEQKLPVVFFIVRKIYIFFLEHNKHSDIGSNDTAVQDSDESRTIGIIRPEFG